MKSIKLTVTIISIMLFVGCKTAKETAVNDSSITNVNWRMEEIRFLQDNKNYFYKRGAATGNNMNFDADYIRFNKDKTGIYHQMDGTEYPLTWEFANSDQKEFIFVIANFADDQPLIVHWQNIELHNSALSYTEYYTNSKGVNSLACGIRIK